ncbi:MAG: chromosome segregation protein SMC [Trueperaceae bacterium]|nr:chromosome segregation protein SMC [Trueperaceae bacterium]
MRIERLVVSGFKSFGERTTLTFDAAVTAIVGPNGSGKSNLVDALRWATGGGRARAYRAEDKTELIFHGASGKKRMGLAEVEVEIGTDDGPLRIRRTLDRDGVTRLKLNGRNARFLDIDEALAGTGLGTGSLAVIGQGEVSGVLMADPSRLLAYVSEAAGVAQLTTRRERTEANLEQARTHLTRLDENIAEDAARVEALTREAEEARRHDELRARANRLRLTIADARAGDLRAAVAELAERVEAHEHALQQGRDTLAELRTALEEARRRDAEAEAAHREAHAAHARAVAELRVAEHAYEAATTRAADLAGRKERAEHEANELAQQEAPQAPDDDAEAAERAADAAEATLHAAREARAEAEAEAEEARRAREALEDRAARAARDAAEAEARHASLTQQLEEVRTALSEADAAAPAADGDIGEEADRAGQARTALAAAESELASARTRLENAQAQHARDAAEARAWDRASQRQRAAFEARQGYAQGPRHALTSGVHGVEGSLADLMRVPEELQEAIGLALGRRAEYVVMSDDASAREVLAHVRERGGWVTLLPLTLVRRSRPGLDSDFEAEAGVIGLASERVSCDARYRPAVDQVLGGTALVDTAERATALAKRYARRPRMVTLDGAILEPGGALSGGRRQGRGPVLGAAAELEEAEATRDRAREAEAAAKAEVEAAQAAFETARAGVEEARAALDRAREAEVRAQEARAADARMREELEGRRQRLEQALAALPEVPGGVAPERLAEVRERDARARGTLADANKAESDAAEAASRTARDAALARERRASHQAALERWRHDRTRAEEQAQEAERLAREAERAWGEAQEAEARVETARAAVPEDATDAERAREEAREALREAEAAVDAANERQTERAEALERARVQQARRESALEAAEEERAGFPDGLEPLALGAKQASAELRRVEAELETIGAVNHRAAHELAELSPAHDARCAEAEEARTAVDELFTTLARLDRETTRRLTAAVDGVREAFRRHVAELFGPEGEGEIDTDHEDGRPVGLRIRLRPPGKRTQALGLLSVGERTMGALAFLFALMGDEHASRLPVAVLDEVDAPLDEANIHRYRRFVERLAAAGTQFVLITHQKATFEVAGALWGVTTQDGVSRVFSIHRDDASAYDAAADLVADEGPSVPS